jgi:hypothetical protein
MSDYGFVADRAKRAYASVARIESDLMRAPGDQGLMTNLSSMRRVAERARDELERIAAANSIEVCQYRIVPAEHAGYALRHVSKSLLNYQALFSQLYDSFKNGPKSKAQLGREAEDASTLNFAYTYAGSLGVVLLAKSERDFFDGNLDRPIEALYQILDINDVDSVRDIARARGRAVVKRIHDWSSANVAAGFSADIRWKRSDGRELGQVIDKGRLSKIVEFIDSTSDEKTETISVFGMLVAASLPSRSFHIAVPGGESYTGHFDSEAPEFDLTLGKTYQATIEVTEIYYYATDKHVKTNSLLNLVSAETLR